MSQRLDARVWVSDGSSFLYPESVYERPLTGVCFSGGGTRSYAATIGQLRGLRAIGLWPRIGYLSAVSGGAWAAIADAFYAGPGRNDDEILGSVREAHTLYLDVLEKLQACELGIAATQSFRSTLELLCGEPNLSTDRIWARAVGETFLAPFGLYDADQPCGFTLDDETECDLARRNPELAPCHVLRNGRGQPFPIVHATLNWPSVRHTSAQKVNFEYTPLYCGSPQLTRLQSGDGSIWVGGGVLDSVAFGCEPPSQPVVNDGRAIVFQAEPFTLADAIGASSAFSANTRDDRFYPHFNCWPIPSTAGPAKRHMFTDGGDLENFGIIPLLRRGVRTIVVFVNTMWPLSLGFDSSDGWPVDEGSDKRVIDPFIAPLFGAPSTRFLHNNVFPETDFKTLVSKLQDAKRAGRGLVTVMRHAVRDNAWWGLSGGWDVEVCWVYNERVPEWEVRLPVDTRREIERGSADAPSGSVVNFPHYCTQGQNSGALIRLTPVQINLLSHLACWSVTAHADELRTLFM